MSEAVELEPPTLAQALLAEERRTADLETLAHKRPDVWPLLPRLIAERKVLLAALTKTEGEPVAWRCEDLILGTVSIIEDGMHAARRAEAGSWAVQPLYTRPPVWPDREAVARRLYARFRQFTNIAELDQQSASVQEAWRKDADAILALSASAGQVEGEGE